MKDTFCKREYKCKCGNIQEEYVWQNELVLGKFKCNSCSSILNYVNLQKKEVPQTPSIRTPTKNR